MGAAALWLATIALLLAFALVPGLAVALAAGLALIAAVAVLREAVRSEQGSTCRRFFVGSVKGLALVAVGTLFLLVAMYADNGTLYSPWELTR
jgi:lysylphosphatidylglycerol synthetase-like protein (DUF2156 family)